MPIILDSIIETLPNGWKIKQINIGVNWTLVEIINPEGLTRAGIAATPDQRNLTRKRNFITA